MSKVHPVILCGGAGSRLWPLSTPEHPKPLLRLHGDRTLLAQTLERVAGFEDPLLVCGAAHAAAVADEAPDVLQLVEDVPRGTAAAVVAAALQLREEILLVVPADHVIDDVAGFRAAVRTALPAVEAGYLVMLGQEPDRAETGYGWMSVGRPLEEAPGVHAVERFVEKPDPARATELLEQGGHLWNMGIFLFRAGALLEEVARLEPDLLEADPPPGSLDVVVMERTRRAAVIPVSLGWDDVGTWDAVVRLQGATRGPAVLVDAPRSWARSEGPTVVVNGLPDAVVVATPDAVLVSARSRSGWRTTEHHLPEGATRQVRGTLVRGRMRDADGAELVAGAVVDGPVTALEPSDVVEVTSEAG